MDNLDLENPEGDAFRNYANENLEFVGIADDSCWRRPTGFGNGLASLVKKSEWTCLEGTSDTLEGDEHSKLMEIAQKYATEYNRYLLEIIEKEN